MLANDVSLLRRNFQQHRAFSTGNRQFLAVGRPSETVNDLGRQDLLGKLLAVADIADDQVAGSIDRGLPGAVGADRKCWNRFLMYSRCGDQAQAAARQNLVGGRREHATRLWRPDGSLDRCSAGSVPL